MSGISIKGLFFASDTVPLGLFISWRVAGIPNPVRSSLTLLINTDNFRFHSEQGSFVPSTASQNSVEDGTLPVLVVSRPLSPEVPL